MVTSSQAVTWAVTAGAVITVGAAVAATQVINTATSSSGKGSAASKATPKPSTTPNDSAKRTLTVGSINVTNLAPGVSLLQQLAIGNPNNQDVDLQTVSTAITDPTPSGGCTSPTDVEVIVAGYNASTGVGPVVTIPRNTTLNLPVTVRMNNRPVSQDGCKGKTFNFVFTATATSK